MVDTPAKPPAPAAPAAGTEPDDDVRTRAVREMEQAEANAPTPSQEELDRAKLNLGKDGSYKTRQTKAG